MLSFEPCAESCPELSCGLSCPHGFVLDNNGCPTCACQSLCGVCDEQIEPVCTRNGYTFNNACLASCNGESVAYAGRCNAACEPLDCGLDCAAYKRNEEGCEICACEMTVCPEARAPVCGINGVTYNNLCGSERAGVGVAFEGVCPPLCESGEDCPQGLVCQRLSQRPELCSEDGSLCRSSCVLPESERRCEDNGDCMGGFDCTEGVCALACSCSPVYAPVCGADGETYFNPCVARCQNREVARVGVCCEGRDLDACDIRCENGFALDGDGCDICQCREVPPCECEPVVNPVCGSDGQTYRNPCEARCVGVRWGEGACNR